MTSSPQDYDEFEFEYTKITKTTRTIPVKKKEEPPHQPLNRLLFGKDLSEYANIPIEDLLNQLTEEELEQLGNEVDPDDPHVPPSMRCKEQTKKSATGPLDRQRLLSYLKKYAMEQEDWPENKPHEPGMKRGENRGKCISCYTCCCISRHRVTLKVIYSESDPGSEK